VINKKVLTVADIEEDNTLKSEICVRTVCEHISEKYFALNEEIHKIKEEISELRSEIYNLKRK